MAENALGLAGARVEEGLRLFSLYQTTKSGTKVAAPENPAPAPLPSQEKSPAAGIPPYVWLVGGLLLVYVLAKRG